MKLITRLLATLTAGLTLAAGSVVADAAPVYTPPTPAVTVYNTPGVQFIGGRAWRTQCAMYSSTVVRCRTEIWASQVVATGSGFRRVDRWAFNNLTYLPSPRAAWAGNNLGRNAAWTDAGGRRWRTECDTPATGGGACRTYATASVIVARSGGYVWRTQWVFNNQVLFSTATVAPVTAVPRTALQRAVLTPTGFGPLQIGTPLSIMHGAYLAPGSMCSAHQGSPEVRAVGVDLMDYRNGTIGNVWTDSALTPIGTSAGVSSFRVGMTLAQLQAAFPGRVQLVIRNGEGGAFQGASVREGNLELLFYKAWDSGDPLRMLPTDTIVTVRAREAAADHYYGC